MEKKQNKSHSDDHDMPPQDEKTRNKIDKHLSDKDDTISEEDIKNINTSTNRENIPPASHKDADEKNEIDEDDDKSKDDDEPEKEAPTPWEVLS